MRRPRSLAQRAAPQGGKRAGAAVGSPATSGAPTEAARLWAALDDAAEAIAFVDADGRLAAVNRGLCALTDFPEADLLGRRWRDLIHPADRAVFADQAAAAAAGVRVSREARALRRDGSEVPLQMTVVPASLDGGGHYLFIRDLTERKKTDELLAVAGRMASVGTLAAGVAHEINNPLAYIVANIDFARQQLSVGSARIAALAGPQGEIGVGLREVEDALAEARQGAERVRSIVRDLKIFARADGEGTGPVSLRRVLESSINMAWNEIRHRARLVKDFGDVPLVEGNESRLGQVFLNLLVNAAQAVEDGAAESNEIRVITRTDARGRAVVEIRDTGAGIPPDIQARIFDPFFTTKPAGVGTGLGLWICSGILGAMAGDIAVTSEPGRGATFRVTLPSVPPEALAVARPAVAHERPASGGRILVVDDEPMIVSALRRALVEEYRITGLTDAREAVARLRKGERFDAILCDLMMPELSGMDLYDEVARVAPAEAERMIFITGGAFTPRAREFLDRVGNPRLEKPIDFQNLRSLLRNALK
ncbi:MAG TPA: ATP-binding protein [Polyangia bacterium]|nr:ATP-binding protein [Polyangia bacterium]